MASTVAQHKTLNPANAYLVRSTITRYNAATNKFEPWTGLTTLVVGFYADALGTTAISTITGITMTESSTLGTYYAVITSTQTSTIGASYNNEVVYQIVSGGPSNEIKVVTPLLVTQPRYAQ